MTELIYGLAGKVYQMVRPVRDPHYLKFIRQFPCVGCGSKIRRSEAMHIGRHGMGQKASDSDALPGCSHCHRLLHALGTMKFQSRHKIDFTELQIMFRGFYDLEFGTGEAVGMTEAVVAEEENDATRTV